MLMHCDELMRNCCSYLFQLNPQFEHFFSLIKKQHIRPRGKHRIARIIPQTVNSSDMWPICNKRGKQFTFMSFYNHFYNRT